MSALRGAVAALRVSPLTVIGVVGVALYVVAVGWAMGNTSFDVWGALVVGPVLIAISLPLLWRLLRDEDDPRVMRLIIAALLFKLGGSIVRYGVAFELYGGLRDADGYHDWGRTLAPMFRHGDFTVELGRGVIGTGFIEIVTGVVYCFTGATQLGGFLVFSWLGFWGLYLFYRAFRIGFPNGDHFRYALLLFFLPSMLFWPSSTGKEAWMTLALGLTAYGCARLLTQRRGGFSCFALGVLATTMARPHLSLIVFLAIAGAYLLRRSSRPSVMSPAAKGFGIVMLLAVGLVVVGQTETFLGVDRLDTGSVSKELDENVERTDEAESTFEAKKVESPIGMIGATLAVLYRPWPFEAHNAQSLFASLEGMVLLVLTCLSVRRLAAIPREMFRTAYVALALMYTLLFVYAFASVGNFGNIARQRVQLFPMALVLICVPARTWRKGAEDPDESSARQPVMATPSRR
jgi:hypothetical protein